VHGADLLEDARDDPCGKPRRAFLSAETPRDPSPERAPPPSGERTEIVSSRSIGVDVVDELENPVPN
jgi:hypothetical protein